jgi:transcription elongation factor Elf1
MIEGISFIQDPTPLILNCPTCGSVAKIQESKAFKNNGTKIGCTKCNESLEFPVVYFDDYLVALWNKKCHEMNGETE